MEPAWKCCHPSLEADSWTVKLRGQSWLAWAPAVYGPGKGAKGFSSSDLRDANLWVNPTRKGVIQPSCLGEERFRSPCNGIPRRQRLSVFLIPPSSLHHQNIDNYCAEFLNCKGIYHLWDTSKCGCINRTMLELLRSKEVIYASHFRGLVRRKLTRIYRNAVLIKLRTLGFAFPFSSALSAEHTCSTHTELSQSAIQKTEFWVNLCKLRNGSKTRFVINPLRNAAHVVPWCRLLFFSVLTSLSLHGSFLPCDLGVTHQEGGWLCHMGQRTCLTRNLRNKGERGASYAVYSSHGITRKQNGHSWFSSMVFAFDKF